MAYISTEEVKNVRNAIKKEFPSYKWSVTRHHSSTITIALMQADFEIENSYDQINHYYLDQYSEKIKNVFTRVKEILFKNAEYFNESDAMSDYFHCAYFYNFNIGKWDKPYICKK